METGIACFIGGFLAGAALMHFGYKASLRFVDSKIAEMIAVSDRAMAVAREAVEKAVLKPKK